MSLKDMLVRSMEYFGLVDEDEMLEDEVYGEPVVREERQVVRGISDSRSRRLRDENYRSLYRNEEAKGKSSVIRPLTASPPKVSLYPLQPKSFNDAQIIADKFKANIPVILNLEQCDSDLSKRLLDFASGLTYALDGGIKRTAEKVFILTPSNVEISTEDRQMMMERGFFNQF